MGLTPGVRGMGGASLLADLAPIIPAADIAKGLDIDPLGPGCLSIPIGGLKVEADDNRLLEKGSFVYDARHE